MDATIISTASAPSVTSLFTPAIASPIHNAGHMVFGPAEAFTPEQLAELYDINVLSTHSESIARCCRICGNSGRGSSSGYRAAAVRAARLPMRHNNLSIWREVELS